MYVIGVMSGTSLDGVDAVLVQFDDLTPAGRTLAHQYQAYPQDLRDTLLALHIAGDDELHRSAMVARHLSRIYASTCKPLLASLSADCAAIACHGQTIRHRPDAGYTIQLVNGALLAELTRTPVITDFRSRDIAAGGQGAPLVPAFHAAAFHSLQQNRAIINIGGIANLTLLAQDGLVRGFDCGPGNLLMNAWCEQHTGQPYDHDGAWAAGGVVLPALLEQLLAHPFFNQIPPKSAGREQFNMDWLNSLRTGAELPQDIQATLLQLTARGITNALEQFAPNTQEGYICGGGAYNKTLVAAIADLNPRIRMTSTAELGIAPDLVEAHAFAWLGRQTLLGLPGNCTAVTGARHACILGTLYPA